MVKFRCINDIFGYCGGKPTGLAQAKEKMIMQDGKEMNSGVWENLTCSNVPTTCKHYGTSIERKKKDG